MDLAIGTVAALVIGLALGFFFERRSSRTVVEENARLRKALDRIDTHVRSSSTEHWVGRAPATGDLSAAVRDRALQTQRADGRVDRHELLAYFVSEGSNINDVRAAIEALSQSGVMEEDGKWLVMK